MVRTRIHIDQNLYESTNPTTGEALYALAQIPHGHELFREVEGNREDPPIPRTGQEVHLKQDEHFHSGHSPKEREYTIIVNGRRRTVANDTLSYDQVVALAFDPVPTGDGIGFIVSYSHGPRENHQGTLVQGQTVRIKSGMIFNVSQSNRS